jgi:hypothetical protein
MSEYNGYTNRETWLVSLWMDNSEGWCDYWVDRGRMIYKHKAKPQKYFTKMEDAICIFAEDIKDAHEEMMSNTMEHMNASLWYDLLNDSLADVDWRQIAKNLLEDVELEAS